MNDDVFRRVLRLFGVLVLLALLLIGLDALIHGADKENITRGVGLDPSYRSADGLALMVFGSFVVVFFQLFVISALAVRILRELRSRR
jgi:hypothetical protein